MARTTVDHPTEYTCYEENGDVIMRMPPKSTRRLTARIIRRTLNENFGAMDTSSSLSYAEVVSAALTALRWRYENK